MAHQVRLSVIAGLLLCMGCATAAPKTQLVHIAAPANLPPKQSDEVQVYDDPSKVPFPYIELGRIAPQPRPDEKPSAKDQIDAIRALAATHGADGVILSKEVLLKGGNYFSVSNGFTHHDEVAIYSGMAILKAPPSQTPPPQYQWEAPR
jgi:hypothetical protein